jgi:hypothetical protein
MVPSGWDGSRSPDDDQTAVGKIHQQTGNSLAEGLLFRLYLHSADTPLPLTSKRAFLFVSQQQELFAARMFVKPNLLQDMLRYRESF